jgi:hypothetical protein
MVAKKKSTRAPHLSEESETLESPQKEERRPPVTQVVEVVEDGGESSIEMSHTPTTDALEDVQTETVVASAPVMREEKEEISEEQEMHREVDRPDEEKRRVLVDELFQKKEESVMPVAPEISQHRKSSMRPMITWAIIVVVASLVVGGAIMVASGRAPSLPSIMATPTPTPTSTPTPTPTPDVSSLDRSTLSVQVLNGSGTSGVAGKMKALLEEKGYSVDNTGNADTYDYESTEVLVKAEHEAFLSLLEEDLQEDYVVGSSVATLEDDVPYDVRIIVGKE